MHREGSDDLEEVKLPFHGPFSRANGVTDQSPISLLSPFPRGALQLLLTGLVAVGAVLGLLPLLHQLLVQFPELLQKAPVGEDTAVLGHLLNGVHQGHVPVDHQVGQDQGRRAAAAHDAVNQDLI